MAVTRGQTVTPHALWSWARWHQKQGQGQKQGMITWSTKKSPKLRRNHELCTFPNKNPEKMLPIPAICSTSFCPQSNFGANKIFSFNNSTTLPMSLATSLVSSTKLLRSNLFLPFSKNFLVGIFQDCILGKGYRKFHWDYFSNYNLVA